MVGGNFMPGMPGFSVAQVTRESPLPPKLLIGCDFSSSPSRRKPIVIAEGSESGGRVLLDRLCRLFITGLYLRD